MLSDLVRQYNLSEVDIYLLDLIPLIEMMWADGKNQEVEIKILCEFALKHVVQLTKHAHGEEVVSISQVNTFIERFTTERPEPAFLKQLREFVVASFKDYDTDTRKEKSHQILFYCMDIAAACISTDDPVVARIGKEEKYLLLEIMKAFDISSERQVY